ncbi:ABC-2 transporter permease, partial [Paenibacillus apiarius]|uniref:ABC-2 transporter permease n=1 Tax=Paenibacillus apiarius TaxID=46240 RepID=UPI003B3B05C4
MFNLILKDILIQKKIIIFYIATIILYLLVDTSLVLIGFIYSVVFIMNAYSYDEKDNANILLNSLPYTRKEIVCSKYIGALIFTSIFIIIIYFGDFLLNGKEALFSWKEVLLIIGLVMVAISFMLPFSYKFKTQYLLIASGVFFASEKCSILQPKVPRHLPASKAYKGIRSIACLKRKLSPVN